MKYWKRAATLVIGLTMSALMSSVAPAHANTSGWTQDGFGPGNTGYNPSESRVNAASVGTLRQRWSTTLADGQEGCTSRWPPLVANGRLFVIEGAGVTALDAATGRRLWRNAGVLDSLLNQRLTVIGGLVLVAGYSCYSNSDPTGHLYALDARTGKQLWHVMQDVAVEDLVADDDTIITSGECAICDFSTVIAYRTKDGVEVWRHDGELLAGEVMSNDRILLKPRIGSGVTAVTTRTGVPLWQSPHDWDALAADPAGERLYVTDTAGALTALNASTGTTAWTIPAAAGTLATDGRRVYVARAGVTTYSATDGRRLWHRTVAEPGRPIRAGGLLYVTDAGRPLAILSPVTGMTVSAGIPYRTAVDHVVVAGGRLYTHDGTAVRAYAP